MHRQNPLLRNRKQTRYKPRDTENPSLFSVLTMVIMSALYVSFVYFMLERHNALPDDGIQFACLCLAPPTLVTVFGVAMLQCILG